MRLLFLLLSFVGAVYAQDELVLVSPHWEGVRKEFSEGFSRRYERDTGRKVEFKWLDVGGTSDILKFIRAEFKSKPEGIGIDLFFGGGVDPFVDLKNIGLLMPHRVSDEVMAGLVPDINGVPLRDADSAWYAATMAGFGIIYNKEILRRLDLPEPKTWEDLARSEVFSWVGSADPRKSGSVHMAYEIILQAYGWQRGWGIITALGANVRGFSGYASQTPKDVTLGEVAYGLAIDSYAWHQVREVGEEMIGFVMPADLTVVNGDGIALLKGAPQRELAGRFVDFVLSEEGQKLWMLRPGEADGPRKYELGKFSVRPDLYDKVAGRTAVQVNPFAWQSDFVYDAERGGKRWGLVNDMIGALIIDPHQDLTRAWQRSAGRGVESVVPLTEEEAMALLDDGRWKDVEYRNRTMAEWATIARGRYGSDSGWRNLPALFALVVGGVMYAYLRRKKV